MRPDGEDDLRCCELCGNEIAYVMPAPSGDRSAPCRCSRCSFKPLYVLDPQGARAIGLLGVLAEPPTAPVVQELGGFHPFRFN